MNTDSVHEHFNVKYVNQKKIVFILYVILNRHQIKFFNE